MIVKTWHHDDGRLIEVAETWKRRSRIFSGMPKAQPFPEWPILWRSEVPNLTDEQWYAMPTEAGWHEVTETPLIQEAK